MALRKPFEIKNFRETYFEISFEKKIKFIEKVTKFYFAKIKFGEGKQIIKSFKTYFKDQILRKIKYLNHSKPITHKDISNNFFKTNERTEVS